MRHSPYPAGAPLARATITAETVTLNPWNPGLLYDGPLAARLRDLGPDVAIADVFADGDELIVAPLPGVRVSEAAAGRLLAWARVAGYRRVWLEDRVVAMPGEVPAGRAQVRCPTCGLRWEDCSARFWEQVSTTHLFPPCCMACGGSLPEWEARCEAEPAPRLQEAA